MRALRKTVFVFVLMGQMLWPFQSNAFFFLPFLAGAGGSAALAELPVGAIVTGLVVAGFIGAGGSDTSPSAQGQIAITPNGVALPSGWSRASDGSVTPPSTTSGLPAYKSNWAGDTSSYSSPALAAAGTGQKLCTSISRSYVSVTNTSGSTWRITCSGSYQTDITVNQNGIICPSGYSGSSSCAIVDPTLVSKPTGMPCQIIRSGNSFSMDPRNPACPGAGGDVTIVDPNGNSLQVVNGQINVVPASVVAGGQTSVDKPRVSIIIDSSGKTGVKQWYDTTMSTVSGSVPATQTNNTDIDSNGKVIGQSGTLTPGTGSQNNPSAVIPQTPSITCTNVGTCDVAKDQTLQGVKSATEEIRDRMKASTDAFAPPTAADYNPAIQALNNLRPSPSQFTGPITDMLRSIGLPSAGTRCELKRTLTLLGHSFDIDMAPQGICGPYQEIANWMTWMLVVIYGWSKVRGMTTNNLEG